MDRKIANQLVKTRKAIKKKLQSLKSDIIESQIKREKEYHPLKEILQSFPLKKENLQDEFSPPLFKRSTKEHSTPVKSGKAPVSRVYQRYLPTHGLSFLRDEDTFLSESQLPDEEISSPTPTMGEIQQSIQDLTTTEAFQVYLENYSPLVRTFVNDYYRDIEDKFDHTHGLVLNIESDKWKLGSTEVDFKGDDLVVGTVRYKGSVGLYELLFKKNPVGYKEKDLDDYIDILMRTNALRRNYDPNEQIQGTLDPKYISIIKPHLIKKGIIKTSSISTTSQFRPRASSVVSNTSTSFVRPRASSIATTSGVASASAVASSLKPTTRSQTKRKKVGAALKNLNSKNVEYVYFDDPNELVERLKLLLSSQMAGHNGHNNEIISIIEELREAKIIQ
jgi:hypothetical protein